VSAWTLASATESTTSFIFNLVSSGGASAGVANPLRLRAVDLAGNASAEGSVVITTDVVAPQAVTFSNFGETNQNGAGTVYWVPNAANTDVAGYHVYYGSATGNYSGTYALQGNSPITIGPTQSSMTFSGLTNGSATYVTVKPFDFAGNEAPVPNGRVEMTVQPNIVSPTEIMLLSLGMTLGRLIVVDDYAYVLGYTGDCSSSATAGATTVLKIVDLHALTSPLQKGVLNVSPPQPTVVATKTWTDGFNCYGDNVTYFRGGAMPDLAIDGPYAFIASGKTLRTLNIMSPTAPIELTPMVATSQLTGVELSGTTLFADGETRVYAVDISSLYDGVTGTSYALVGAPDAGYVAPAGSVITHNWLIQPGFNYSANAYGFDITNAIDNDAGTVFDNTALKTSLTTDYGFEHGHQRVSGNMLYVSSQFEGFSVTNLHNLWNWSSGFNTTLTTYAQSQTGGSGPFDVVGGQAFLGNDGAAALPIYDLTNVTSGQLALEAVYVPSAEGNFSYPNAVTVWGNYLLALTRNGSLLAMETATPRALHLATSVMSGSSHVAVEGGFVFGSNMSVLDLQSGWPPVDLNPNSTTQHDCAGWDLAMFGEQMVTGEGPNLKVVDFTNLIDRDPTTPWSAFTNYYSFALPNVVRVSGLKAYGNYLVAVETRSDGMYLDVFNAKAIRNILKGQQLTAAASVTGGAGFKFNSITDPQAWGELTMHYGRAFVGVDTDVNGGSSSPNPGFFIVDLRPLLDDDASTTTPIAQGSLPISHVRQSVVMGNTAWITTYAGLQAWDVTNAMDDVAATTVTATMPIGTSSGFNGALALAVHGSYAYVSTGYPNGASVGPGTYVIDISTPATPTIIGYSPIGTGGYSCSLQNTVHYASLVVRGSRLYLNAYEQAWIFEVE
jgi:hypothetical protein